MYRLRRIPILILGILLVLVITVGTLGVISVRRPFPKTEGEINLPGLNAAVEVFRDSFGVPHIYAKTNHDLFMTQGFIHSQDRFWQMEFFRRVGSGRLAELMGPGALGEDLFIRTIGWHRTAAQEVENLLPDERAILEAYSEGVNAYLELNKGRQALEFSVLRLTGLDYEPEPWTILNSLTWAKFMAWDLGGNMGSELTRAHIAARLGTLNLSTIVPPYRNDFPYIVPQPLSSSTLQSIPDAVFDNPILRANDDIGSNSWVVSGDRTESGMPLLANDPHLGIRMPSIWYEIGLHCDPVGPECPYNVVGASFASAPGVIIGHNDHIAWGFTNVNPDVQDLFIERVNPENPNQYEYQGQWLDMEIIREEIVVAGEEDPVVVNARITRHGPIINDIAGGEEEDWYLGWQPLALSWTALEPGTVIRAVLLLNKAQNWDQFRTALSYFDVPSQNVVYADVEGNIGYQTPGRIPIRLSGDGSMPVPGWSGEYEWVDVIPYDRLPTSFNPTEGFIVTANNAVVGPEYPYFISMDWAPGYRARRIIELIDADTSLSIEDMKVFQADSSPIYARDVLPLILDLNPSEPRLREALDILRSWDGRTVRDSTGAAIFEVLRLHLIEETFRDELGEQLFKRARGDLIIAITNILANPESLWFDDVTTVEVEGKPEILIRAFEGAVDELTDKLGRNMANWEWGALHTATFENETLGRSGIGPIEALFNRGPVAVDGSWDTVNNTSYGSLQPYEVRTVPSYRQIIDLSDLGNSLSMHTTGQSGHPFHPHYKDMIDPWRNFEYHQMLWNRHLIEAVAESKLTLTP